MLGMFIAAFVSDSWRWLAGILPSFWLGELILGKCSGLIYCLERQALNLDYSFH